MPVRLEESWLDEAGGETKLMTYEFVDVDTGDIVSPGSGALCHAHLLSSQFGWCMTRGMHSRRPRFCCPNHGHMTRAHATRPAFRTCTSSTTTYAHDSWRCAAPAAAVVVSGWVASSTGEPISICVETQVEGCSVTTGPARPDLLTMPTRVLRLQLRLQATSD